MLDIPWETAETEEFCVEYKDWRGKTHKYYPDFFIYKKCIVEIKPKVYQKSKTVLAKQAAIKIFCKKMNYDYAMVSPKTLSKEILEKLYTNGDISIDANQKSMFERYLERRKF